jgi:hypothetical protein
MTSQLQSQTTSLNYEQLIKDYKRDYFKKMPILHHEFIYACFHPLIPDTIIALEKNYYPLESELYSLANSEKSFY